MTTRFVDNSATFVTGLTEADAYNTLGAAVTAASASDVIRVRSTHVETANAVINYTFPATIGLQILSVTFNGLGTGGLAAGGTINVGAANAALTMDGHAYIYGITFNGGTNNNAACDILVMTATATASQSLKFDTCTLAVPSASTTAQLTIGVQASSAAADLTAEFINCTFSAGAVKSILFANGTIYIENLTLAGTAPTTVFAMAGTGRCSNITIVNSDLSGVAWTNLVSAAAYIGYFIFKQCKFRSGFTFTTGAFSGPGLDIIAIDCDSGDNHYKYLKSNWSGTIVASNSIYEAASNGTDSFSLLMTASANASFSWPLAGPEFTWFNSALSAMTSSVEVNNDGTTFKDNELWQNTTYKGTSGFTTATVNRGDRAADILASGANQDTSTASWTGTGGFGAEVKQKLVSTSFTPAEVGPITVTPKLAKASASVYISPKVLSNASKVWLSMGGQFINEQPLATYIAGIISG